MDGEKKLCVAISKFSDGYEVKVDGVRGIELLSAFSCFSESVKKHVGKVMWFAIICKFLNDVYKEYGEEEYQHVLELVADHIGEI